ncbi:MAG TPA: ATP-binding protein [Myxococcota bacterium]
MTRARLLERLPLRAVLPAVALAALVAITLSIYLLNARFALRDVENQALARLRLDLTSLQVVLAELASEGNLAAAQRSLAARGRDGELERLVFVDDRGVVVASLARAQIGVPWSALRSQAAAETAVDLAALVPDALRQGAGVVRLDPRRRHALAVFPVTLGARPHRSGTLYAQIDLERAKQAQRREVIGRTSWLAGAVLAAVVIGCAVMELAVFRRIAKLARAAELIAQGSAPVHLPSGGVRELASVTASLQSMVDRLQRNERLARDGEALLRMVVDSAPSAICLLDARGRVVLANAALARVAGLAPGTPLAGADLNTLLPAKTVEFFRKRNLEILGGAEPISAEGAFEMAGARRHISVHAQPVEVAGEGHVLYVVTDLSEHVVLEEQVRQSQKLEIVGRVAAGLAHDFNNLLTIVLGDSDSLATRLPESEARVEALEIRQAAERAAALTRRLLQIARPAQQEDGSVELGELIAGFEPLLRSLLGEGVRVATELAPGSWPVAIAPARFEQLLLNFAVNARDAMPAGGWLTLRVKPAPGDADGRRWVSVEVSDTGAGMSAETRARALEPFFTTKGAGEGTGLGLAICQGIVAEAGGRIELESELERGTTVRVLLPLAAERRAARERAGEALPAAGGRETILLVEDDANLLALCARGLTAQGYRVLAASSADDAMRVASAERGEIALLLSDVVMPGRSGIELSQQLHRRRPLTKLLFASGYGEQTHAKLTELGLEAPVLDKPFTPAALARAVRAALDAR